MSPESERTRLEGDGEDGAEGEGVRVSCGPGRGDGAVGGEQDGVVGVIEGGGEVVEDEDDDEAARERARGRGEGREGVAGVHGGDGLVGEEGAGRGQWGMANGEWGGRRRGREGHSPAARPLQC